MTDGGNEKVADILIVDDSVPNLNLLGGMLRERGYRARAVPSGKLALQAARTEPPDLILLDINMPEMTGYEVCERLKADPLLAEIPVVFLSAREETMDKIRAFGVGGVDYIGKPFQLEEVEVRVRTHVTLHRQQRRLERANRELEALNRELDTFSYSVSHDLRAPLRHIEGFAQLLREDAGPALGDKGIHHVDVIVRSTRRMGLLIDALLQFSRLGRQPMDVRPVRLGPLVEEVVAEAAALAPGRRIEWTVGELPVVMGDSTLLRAVFVNLIGNAVKFTRDRDPAHIQVSARAGEEGHAVVQVADDGAGFDLARAEKLFGAFQRFHTATEFEGTGIGLATVQRIVHRHGGRVWAEAAPGAGATFFLSLPEAAP